VIIRRPKGVLLATVCLLVIAAAYGAGVAGSLHGLGITDPGAPSSKAGAILGRHFPASNPDLVLLVATPRGPSAADAAGAALTARLAAEPSLAGVTSYWQAHAPDLRSRDGRYALITARIRATDTSEADRLYKTIAPRYSGVRSGLTVRIGGVTAIRNALQDTITADLIRAEAIALPLTLIVLVLVFGSWLAALLPVGVGILAIAGTGAVLRLIAQFTDVSVFAQNLTTALGLGLAIDYSLLIVRRFREELTGGATPAEAVAATLRTAGRTVIFSALTVGAALATMMIFPLYFLRSFAYAGVPVVALAAAGALLPLPAALVLLGRHVRGKRAPAHGRSALQRVAHMAMRRAPVFMAGALALLAVLTLPFLHVKYGTADYRQLPASAQARQVQQTVHGSFPGSATGVLYAVLPPATPATGEAARVSRLPGVVRVESPAGVFADGRRVATGPAGMASGPYQLITVTSDFQDISQQSLSLVRAVRADVPTALVDGASAELADSQAAITGRLPWALGVIVAVTLLVMYLMTGSVLLPVKTVLVNALSLTAMFGAVVWVFQDGHLSALLGFTATGFIETSLPVLMFCVAFGLSMDYGVFLMSRIKEEYDRTGDNKSAIARGLARTGGLITSAAMLLAIVLAAIGTSQVMNMKMLGLGLAFAVVVDATVVRLLLVPSVMAIAGRATWWSPRLAVGRHRMSRTLEA